MIAYKKVYLDYYGLTVADWLPCESCGTTAVDIHHILFKSQGGKDVIENLVSLCRDCHNKCHNSPDFNDYVQDLHLSNI